VVKGQIETDVIDFELHAAMNANENNWKLLAITWHETQKCFVL